MKKKYLLAIIGLMISLGIGVYVYANPIFFPNQATTGNATATTTYAWMTPGTGTTTVSFDSYRLTQSSTNAMNATGALGLSLAVQLTATSGVPTLNISCEKSRDGIDWYKGDCYDTSTTTNTYNLSDPSTLTWVFASSTSALGGAAPSATANISTRIFELRATTRFTRAVFTLASTTAVASNANDNASLYAELMPTKERDY